MFLKRNFYSLFVSFHFSFSFFVSFGDEYMKIQKYYVIFVFILQGKMGKSGKTEI